MKILKFSATWCGPCKMLSKKFEKEGIVYEDIDVDDNPERAAKYGVRSLPTVVIVDESGTTIRSMTGANLNEEQMKALKEVV
jgi:thiol-disulfide isomerase/thioredoxin